jgi:hypothetical protein
MESAVDSSVRPEQFGWKPIWAWICGVHFWAGFSARQRLSQGITTSMDVVILCGGQGARMREETEYRPKPMVEVGGRRSPQAARPSTNRRDGSTTHPTELLEEVPLADLSFCVNVESSALSVSRELLDTSRTNRSGG